MTPSFGLIRSSSRRGGVEALGLISRLASAGQHWRAWADRHVALMPNGLRLEFHYAPEFMHQAVEVQGHGQDTECAPDSRTASDEPRAYGDGGYVRWEFDGYYIDGRGR